MFPRYFILSLALLWIGVVQGETVQFTLSNLSVNENAGTTTLTVERVGSSEGEFSANYATRDETAIAGEDYEAATGTLTWRDGEIGPKDFIITIKNDEEFEEDETFYVEIKDSAGNALATTTLTILDDDGENKSSSAAEILMNTAKNSTQKEMGRVVGTVCQSGQASPRLQQRCDELVINAEEFPNEVSNALQQMAPEEFATQGRIASQTTAAQFKNVNARMDVLRTGVRTFSLSALRLNINGQRLPTELFGSLLTLNNATDARTKNVGNGFSRLGAFVNGEINFGDKDTTDRESGFEFSTLGLTAGIDYRFTNNFIAGMALGYSNSETDLNADGGNIDSDGYSVTLYGTFYQSNDFYIDGLYSYGRNSYDSERNIIYQVVMPINQTAFSSNDSDQHALGLGVGYHFNRQAFTFTPNARLDYVKTDIDGFSEKFNDPAPGSSLGFAIDSQKVKLLTLTLGIQADYTISQSWGILIPHANLDYVHEFKDDVRQLTGRFLEDAGGETFTWNSEAPDRDYFNLGLGISAQFSQGRAAFIRYEGTLGLRDVDRHAIMAGVRLEF
jgi:outer membrane autotransporter protein